MGQEPREFLFFSFFLLFCFNCRVCLCMKPSSGIAAQRAERPEDCVDSESVDRECKRVVLTVP